MQEQNKHKLLVDQLSRKLMMPPCPAERSLSKSSKKIASPDRTGPRTRLLETTSNSNPHDYSYHFD